MSQIDLEKEIRCKCDEIMSETEFQKHFKKCDSFKKTFKKFDETFSALLKTFSEPKDNLLIIRFLLKQYISVLTKKIKAHFIEINNISSVSKKKTIHQNKEDDSGCQESEFSRPFTVEVNRSSKIPSKNSEVCQICNDTAVVYLECCHCICKKCFCSLAEKDIANMACEICKKEKRVNVLISEKDKKEILGLKEYDSLYDKCNLALLGDIIECPQCHEKNSFEKGEVDYNIRDENNKKLSKQAAEHYAENRCRCLNCHTIFCISCKAIPYHLGKTCQEYQSFVSSLRCRYDNTVITDKTRGPSDFVCMNNECTSKYKISCKKLLPCGHVCFGYKKELKCPPCLIKECSGYVNLFDQDVDSYCNICFIEGLGNAPAVRLSCDHFLHFKCVETRLKKKWPGPKITFGHCMCPVCNKWLDCPTVPAIQDLINYNKNLYDKISKMALERLKFEGLDKDKRLTDPNSKWYGNELSYALNRLTYYMCYECKEPYFAGLRECGDGPNVNQNDPNKEYNPKDCICGKHANIFGVAGVTECKTHGKDFIEYKCRFCCKIASWFCWGTTHFCDDCHQRQCQGDYISKYPKELLPKCDKRMCEIKVPHPPNGEEFALGCRVCRIESANQKNF